MRPGCSSSTLVLLRRSAAQPLEARLESALAVLGRTGQPHRRGRPSAPLSTSWHAQLLSVHSRHLHSPRRSQPQPPAPSSPPSPTTLISTALSLPRFQVPATSLHLLSSPRHFYQTLLRLIDGARDRIFLSSLYFGKREVELIDHLRVALHRSPTLRVHLLADSLRSTREGPFVSPTSTSGASLLASLARDFPDRVDVRLYRAPGLPGWLERLVGKRFVEGWGLQHMKVYGCDDQVIISGANLSTDYFTNRQDRYLVISDRTVSDYLHSMMLLVSRFSYSLTSTAAPLSVPEQAKARASSAGDDKDDLEKQSHSSTSLHHAPYTLKWDGGSDLLLTETHDGSVEPSDSPAALTPPDFSRMEKEWKRRAGEEVREFTRRWRDFAEERRREMERKGGKASVGETVMANVVPLLQMGPLGITQETDAIPMLFEHLADVTSDNGGGEDKGQGGVARPEEEGTDFEDVIGPDSSSVVSTSSNSLHRRPPPTPLVDLTSGYFSLYAPYATLLLSPRLSNLPVRIITASPRANGFYGSKGVSRHLPAAYTWLERRFWERARDKGRIGGERGVEIREWERNGWTYHAKGIWLRASRSSPPHLTLIGSSNLGNRSAKLDLECTLLVDVPASSASEDGTEIRAKKSKKGKINLTSNESLPAEGTSSKRPTQASDPFPEQLKDEITRLREHALRNVVDEAMFGREERRVAWGVRVAAWVIRGML